MEVFYNPDSHPQELRFRNDTGRAEIAALSVETNAPPVAGEANTTCSRPGDRLPSGSCTENDKSMPSRQSVAEGSGVLLPGSVGVRRTSEASGMELMRPERTSESPPISLAKDRTSKPGDRGNGKPREAPGVSRLRAPGWGRSAAITAIPPAICAADARVVDVSLAAAAAAPGVTAANGPTTTSFPGDLLTPITEATTVDERSALSCGTGGTTKMTPASSTASGPKRENATAVGGTRGNRIFRRRNAHYAQVHHRCILPAPGVGRLERPAGGSGCRGDRNQHARQKRAEWGSGSVASAASGGAHSAPGGGTVTSIDRDSAPVMYSSSACGSPLAPGGDRVGARGSSLSIGSGGRRSGGEAGGGYVAAMGRRARSVARCEAARRLAAVAKVSERARPSTPIEERARWGKGRESRVEVERRLLLQRRSEYAAELKRRAKVGRGIKQRC